MLRHRSSTSCASAIDNQCNNYWFPPSLRGFLTSRFLPFFFKFDSQSIHYRSKGAALMFIKLKGQFIQSDRYTTCMAVQSVPYIHALALCHYDERVMSTRAALPRPWIDGCTQCLMTVCVHVAHLLWSHLLWLIYHAFMIIKGLFPDFSLGTSFYVINNRYPHKIRILTLWTRNACF